MKAGTAMDPHPESYEGDPLANVRLEDEPPRVPEDEDEEGEQQPAPENPDDEPDDEAAALRASTAKLTG